MQQRLPHPGTCCSSGKKRPADSAALNDALTVIGEGGSKGRQNAARRPGARDEMAKKAKKEEEGAAGEEAPKSKKKLFMIIGAVVLLAAAGGGGWFFLKKPSPELSPSEGANEPLVTTPAGVPSSSRSASPLRAARRPSMLRASSFWRTSCAPSRPTYGAVLVSMRPMPASAGVWFSSSSWP